MQERALIVEEDAFEDHPLRLDTLVERSVLRAPYAVGAVFRDETRTFSELNGSANQVARVLRRHGAGPNTYVSLCVERSLSAITALLGIAKSGAAFVPMDTTSPDDRLRSMVADTRPAVLIVDDAARAHFDDYADTIILTLTQLFEAARDENVEDLLIERPDNDIAYVIYTSGSTGTPKGVMVEHRSACNMLLSSIADFDLTPADRVLQLAPLTFDPSIWQIFGTLAAGGCIVIPPAGTERDVDAIVREIQAHAVTVLIAVPALLSVLVERDTLFDASTLRIVVSGGAQLTPALRDSFRARHIPLYNVYGPTETSIHVTTHRCDDTDERNFVPIGTPISNMHIYVLDESGEPVRPGGIGEIHIGGIGVARGYLNRDDLTAERFAANPFVRAPHARLYRTGDLARVHADRAIEFVGRADDQVKLRGVRIELDEIVYALERHPQVVNAAVIVVQDRVHAYVVPRGSEANLPAELRSYARTVLPAIAVPVTFSLIGELPQLANGKIDRAALPEPSAPPPSRVAETTVKVDATHPLADVVLDLWEQSLGLSDLQITDNYFDLGGDSLMAARLVSCLESRVGRRVSLGVFFEDPTVGGMIAAVLDEERGAFEPVLALRTEGSRPPFFYLHGDVNGLGLYARGFGSALGDDRPIYTIAPHGTFDSDVPPTIEAMAEDHLREILARAPEGPIALGGFCLGAIVAFEIARQLEQRDREVVHLTMAEVQRARRVYERYIENPLLRLATAVGLRGDSARKLVGSLRAPMLAIGERLRPLNHDRVGAAHRRAVRSYLWEPVRASATILYAEEDDPTVNEPQVRALWSDLFSSLDVRAIPGNHRSALGRHIEDLTSALEEALNGHGPAD
jgi:amino acid adenylation domain-containing protein